jgi:hypothetical protein
MSAQYLLPIFDENNDFMGVWSGEEKFEKFLSEAGEFREATLRFHLAQLVELMEPTVRALSNPERLRKVPNSSVDLGNKVRLDGGVFVMMRNEKAPTEELSRPDSLVAYKLTRFTFDDGRKSCQVLVREEFDW